MCYLTYNIMMVTDSLAPHTVYPKQYAHGFCFAVVIHWLIFPYPSGLLHWHCGNLTIAPVPAKQPWWIWINTSCEFIMNDCITTTKQSTTKPCAYFLGYTVGNPATSNHHAATAAHINHYTTWINDWIQSYIKLVSREDDGWLGNHFFINIIWEFVFSQQFHSLQQLHTHTHIYIYIYILYSHWFLHPDDSLIWN